MAEEKTRDQREAVDALLKLVIQEMKAGKSRPEVTRKLIDMGWEERTESMPSWKSQKKEAGKMDTKKTIAKRMASYFLFIVTFFVVLPAQASVDPPRFEATLAEGESTMDPIQANLPGIIPSADIVFSLDLTGSMGMEVNLDGRKLR